MATQHSKNTMAHILQQLDKLNKKFMECQQTLTIISKFRIAGQISMAAPGGVYPQ
jgi:hypothetical protein